jgi:glycosyltransferase involved in cell wall biosynthesis
MNAPKTADGRARRVLVINSFANSGGSQHATIRLARQLKSRGHDAEAWFLYRKGELLVTPGKAGVPIKVLLESSKITGVDYIKLPFRLFGWIRRFRPDAVITFLPFASAVVQPLALLSGVSRRVASQRVPACTYSPLLRVLDRLFGTVGIFSNIVCVSEAVRNSFVSYPEAYKRRLSVIHNGIEWNGPAVKKNDARAACGMSEKEFNVLGVGRLCQQKNFALAIEAIARTRETRLRIAGDGPDRAALEQLAAGLGVADRVNFLGNWPAERIADLYAASDAFVLPSLFEGQSNALLEAMHSALPIVASDIEMQRETLHIEGSHFAGYLLPLDDPEAWAQALAQLRDNKTLRSDFAVKAYDLVNDRFNLHKMVDKFEALFQTDAGSLPNGMEASMAASGR